MNGIQWSWRKQCQDISKASHDLTLNPDLDRSQTQSKSQRLLKNERIHLQSQFERLPET